LTPSAFKPLLKFQECFDFSCSIFCPTLDKMFAFCLGDPLALFFRAAEGASVMPGQRYAKFASMEIDDLRRDVELLGDGFAGRLPTVV
jgi:hypothetical protein